MTTPPNPYMDMHSGLRNNWAYFIDIFNIPSGESVQFDAFVTSFDDSYESDWASEDVYGRMDPIQTFKGTKRTIALEWEVVAASIEEAEENLNKCTQLFGMLYPVYSPSGQNNNMVVSSPPLFRVRFVNLIRDVGASTGGSQTSGVGSAESSGLVCTMGGFSYSPDMDAGFLHRGPGTVYPQTIKLSADLTVMHTHGLGYTASGRRQPNFPYGDGESSGGGGGGGAGTPEVQQSQANDMTGGGD